MGALNWIGQLVEWFASLIPRIGICKSNEAGVKYVRGSVVKVIEPGMYVHWPITTIVETESTARQTAILESQTLTTSDDHTVTVSGVLVYYINDIMKALVDTEDIDDTLGDIAMTAQTDAVISRTFEAAKTEIVGLDSNKELTVACRKALAPFGIRVQSYTITNFAETIAYQVMGVPQEITLNVDDGS